MPRYYDIDKLKALIEAKADTLLESKEAFLYVSKWLDLLPHEDVAEVIHAYWKTVTEIKDNTVCGDGRQIQYKICSNCEQPMGVCGNDYCGHCGARMDGEKIFTPEYMQSVFQAAQAELERIKNSPGGGWGPSFKQLDYELMDDRFKSNSGKDTTGENVGSMEVTVEVVLRSEVLTEIEALGKKVGQIYNHYVFEDADYADDDVAIEAVINALTEVLNELAELKNKYTEGEG